jgi:predicted permease
LGSGLGLDVRLAARAIATSRSVSVPAILSLALAIGATTSVFSVVNALLLRPLPVAAPDRLLTVTSAFAIDRGFPAGAGWSHAMWEALRQRSAPFEGVLAWTPQRFAIGTGPDAETVDGVFGSGGFFATLGVPAAVGRTFTVKDDDAGEPVAVISHRLWRRRFGGSADAIGAPLIVDGARVTIVGVTPPAFLGLEVGRPFDVALPLGAEPVVRGARATIRSSNAYLLLILLRLKAAQTIAAATATLRAAQPEIVTARAPSFVKEPFVLVGATASGPASPQRVFRRPMVVMLGGVALVLLVACVNIANLLLARAVARRREIGVRLALGASRWRVARPLLVESVAMAAAGGAIGLAVATWGARAIVSLSPAVLDVSIDWRVAAFAAAITLATAAIFGVVPAWRAASISAPASLRPATGLTPRDGRLSSGLIAVQMALALIAVLSAALFARTFAALATRPLGFDAARILVATVRMPPSRSGLVDHLQLSQRLADAARAVPGVEAAAGSLWTPLSGEGAVIGVSGPGASAGDQRVNVLANFVAPGWFSVYGIPMRGGRDFTARDSVTAPRVAIVNEAFVRRFLGAGVSPLGASYDGSLIVGLVGDAVYRTTQRIPGLTSVALREPVAPTMYVPLAQVPLWNRPPVSAVRVSLRASGGRPVDLARGAAAAFDAVDRNLIVEFRPVSADLRASLGQERLSASVASIFGAFSLLLAALGIYGVTSYAIGRRTSEIGVRMALGATPRRILRSMLARAMAPVALGVVLGLAGAALAARSVSSLLFGVTPLDPSIVIAVALLLMVAAALAALAPAVRASRIDPWRALRTE